VIDDNSSVEVSLNKLLLEDNSDISVRLHRISSLPAGGVSNARKLGHSLSSGSFICFLDADDQFELRKIEFQVGIMLNYPDVIMSHSGVEILTDDLFEDYQLRYNADIAFNLYSRNKLYKLSSASYSPRHNRICMSSCMIRKLALDKIDIGFMQPVRFHEDLAMWCLLSEIGFFYFISDKITLYRVGQHSYTNGLLMPGRLAVSDVMTQLCILSRARKLGTKLKALMVLIDALKRLYFDFKNDHQKLKK
jgi:glycosyltransferase involved in cell wall biosynthesis